MRPQLTVRRVGLSLSAMLLVSALRVEAAAGGGVAAPGEVSSLGSPLDAFVLRKLRDNGLTFSPPADRRTLIRRLSFDFLGLPPTPEQVADFVDGDAPEAYALWVDRLLASPHYGERWARHWLDVARFGESQGFERDKLRPDAWRYRDWVIDAFNADLPYDEFARWQIAGDVLAPDDAAAITATGFLVAGPFDEVGQSQQSAAMRAVVRQDELEDIVGTVGQTFLGLTVHCARCHDHKFDPIRQREYYQLAAALGGVRHGERPILTARMTADIAELEQRRAEIDRQIAALEEPARQALLSERQARRQQQEPPRPLARWEFDDDLRDAIGSLHGTPHGGARIDGGRLILDGQGAWVSTSPISTTLAQRTLEVWLQLAGRDQRGGGALSVQTLDGAVFDAIVYGEREPQRWMAGSDQFRRTQSFAGPAEETADGELVHVAIVYAADGRLTAYRNGVPYGESYRSEGPVVFERGRSQILFGLRHGTDAGGNRLLAGSIDRAQLYDRALSAAEVAASFAETGAVSATQIAHRMTSDQRRERDRLHRQRAELATRLDELRNVRSYAVVPRDPDVAHVLIRGNAADPGDVVSPAGVAAVRGVDPDFSLAPDAPEGERRVRLANWIASPQNPLFARVIVNRLWHYHFGTGLVDTPNDFGFNGGRPSHPELLDYLAASLVERRWSLKDVQRLIVMSAAYRQAARHRPECAAVDAGNRLLWRKEPRRVEAEALRDAILFVSGQLNPQFGGPSYKDFKSFTNNSQFYEMADPVGDEFNRRTIYRTWLRSGRQRFLDVFDCPDPSTTTPSRAVTTTPAQSLALLNNSFVLRMAERMSHRIRREAGAEPAGHVERAFRLVYGRGPDDAERDEAVGLVADHGLAALCRVLLNSNEFLYVE